jgi:hypothetical protein
MKRKISILIPLLVLLSAAVYAGTNAYVIGVAGVVGEEPLDCGDATLWIDKAATSDYWTIAGGSTQALIGQGDFIPGADKTICSIDAQFRAATGSANYVCEIRTFVSGDDLNSDYICQSDAVAIASGISDPTTKTFTFSGGCEVSAATNYAIIFARSDYGTSTNTATIYVSSTSNDLAGTLMRWWGAGDFTLGGDEGPSDMGIKINAYDTP